MRPLVRFQMRTLRVDLLTAGDVTFVEPPAAAARLLVIIVHLGLLGRALNLLPLRLGSGLRKRLPLRLQRVLQRRTEQILSEFGFAFRGFRHGTVCGAFAC